MPALPLKLRISGTPLPVAAGWLPVADPALWLEEAGRLVSAKADAEVKFFPLASSAQDQRAAGVVITVGVRAGAGMGAAGTGSAETDALPLDRLFSPRVLRLGEALPGVLVPVAARIEPALTEGERRRFFPWALHFLHPVLGLSGFEERDALRPWQLLAGLPVVRARWFDAVPGPMEPPPLKQLTLVRELSLEEMLSAEGGGIGSEAPDKDLAPGGGLLGKAAGLAAGTLGALGAGVLSGLGGGTAAEKISQWSQRVMRDLQDRRQRELNKLLDRFDKDLLDALRHAIPLTGAEARRGNSAQPGWKLGQRNPELTHFSHGGGVVDVWNIASDTRLKLERKYREAAAREAAAGHFGRAAYIYGELLGDWARAAEMLEKAGRPREAARIYTERLRSGLRAAQCLEKAGLLAEAAVLFREAGQFEKAGDLLSALGQEAEARDLWETALKSLSHPLQQAKLLETKLADPDRALATLRRAWPGSSQAQACFEAQFALLGRLGRHEAAGSLLELVERDAGARFHPASAMVAALHQVFTAYPDFAVRSQASTLATPLIGEALGGEVSRQESAKLLTLLPRFAPGDVLLARDAGRFSLTKHRPAVPLLERQQKTALRPDRVIELNKAGTWDSLTDSPEGPHVMGWLKGFGDNVPDRIHTLFQGPVLTGVTSKAGILFSFRIPPKFSHFVRPHGKQTLVMHSAAEQMTLWSNTAGSLVQRGALALGPGRSGEFVLLTVTETGTLAAEYYGSSGELHETRVLDYAPPGMEQGTWFTGAHGHELWIAGMEAACCVTEKGAFLHTSLNGPLTGFAIAPPVLPNQAMAAGGHEVVLLIPQGPGKPLESVNLFASSQTLPPVCAFTNDGRAIIADAAGGVIYELRNGCRKLAEIIIPPGSGGLTAATPIGPTGFAFLTKSAQVLGFGF